MSPTISIVTVVYNSENTIERTIKSVLNQSYQNFEYIVVDGGSTDQTNIIINKYKLLFNGRLQHISEPDQGIYDAMNKGINLAKGQLVGLLNSDDYYFENTLATVNLAYKKSDRKSVITGELIFKTGNCEQLLKTSEERFIKKMNQFKNGLRHPATFVPKAIYNAIGLFNLNYKIASDAELIFRIYKAGYSFKFVNKPLVIMSDGGISNSKGITQQILKDKKQLLRDYCPNRLTRLYYTCETKCRFFIKDVASNLIFQYRKRENK